MKKSISFLILILFIFCLVSSSSRADREYIESQIESVSSEGEYQTIKDGFNEDSKDKITIAEEQKKIEEPKVEEIVNDKKTVVIDPGHGALGNSGKEKQSPDSNIMKIKDPGGAQGISTKVPEYVINMKVSLKLKALLEQNNINVIMTKTENNVSPGNIERAGTGNVSNADLAIRIHCDSAETQSVNGASMLVPASVGYAKNISTISKQYGQTILNNLVAEAGMYNRGISERSDLTGFNWSKVPVVLVELGFMSNQNEDRLLNEEKYEDKLAKGLCNGILKALEVN